MKKIAGLLALLGLCALSSHGVESGPLAIPTFHCLGIYWSPPGGAAGKDVLVRFRQQGTAEWKTGLPMRYNPIPKTEEDLADYRGSIVHLAPATTYEIQLTLADTPTTATLTATTWSERFPEGVVERVASRETPLAITASGAPGVWRVYDGRGATIDVRHQHDACITINASNVIVRGFTLKGAGAAGNTKKGIIGAIRIEGGRDIVIEDCDISDWGRLNPKTGFGFDYDAALFSNCKTLRRLIVQRCKLHHPAFDGSTWYEPKYPTHTMGPQYINNILHLRSADGRCQSEAKQNCDNSFDFDLFNGKVPEGSEAHGVRGEPRYAAGAGFDAAKNRGIFQLDSASPGVGAGEPLPNFSAGYTGKMPDIGAHQRGTPPMRFGVSAREP